MPLLSQPTRLFKATTSVAESLILFKLFAYSLWDNMATPHSRLASRKGTAIVRCVLFFLCLVTPPTFDFTSTR